MTQRAPPPYMMTMMTVMENTKVVGRSVDFLGERERQRKRLLLLWHREKKTAMKKMSRPSKLRHQPPKQMLLREAISKKKQGIKGALRARVHCLGLVVSSTTMPRWIQVLMRTMRQKMVPRPRERQRKMNTSRKKEGLRERSHHSPSLRHPLPPHLDLL